MLLDRSIHGVSNSADLEPGFVRRDTRPFRDRFVDFLGGSGSFVIMCGGVVLTIWPLLGLPYFVDILTVFGLILTWRVSKLKARVPFRKPLDPDEIVPKGEKPGDGIVMLGNEIGTGANVYFSNDDVRTHMLVFGSTGSGKTRFLLGLLYQALLMGSGCIYVDGKADNQVFWYVFSMCRRLGREDDLLIINYLTGGAGPNETDTSLGRLTNTTNPFAYGRADNMRSIIVGLMREAGSEGGMWKGRASAMLLGVLRALEVLRDRKEIELDIEKIREYTSLNKIIQLSLRSDLPKSAIDPILRYLVELPGYKEEEAMLGQVNGEAYKQHTFLTMQLTEVMTELSETYAHIFKARRGEVDFEDVLFNRRILFVLLPALEKDPDALAGLGKLVVAGMRSALTPALGSGVEGSRKEVIERKPTMSNVPFWIILDEYGYYAVKGFSIVAAQARSLGIAVVFAGQDIQSFERGSKEEAGSIIANTNIKIAMKIEDPKDTMELIERRGFDSDVTVTSGYENPSTLFGGYADQRQVRIEKRKRINPRDIVDQDKGQAHIIFGDRICRTNLVYVDPYEVPYAELNKFLMVGLPDPATLKAMSGESDCLDELFNKNEKSEISTINNARDDIIDHLLNDYRQALAHNLSPLNAGAVAVGSLEIHRPNSTAGAYGGALPSGTGPSSSNMRGTASSSNTASGAKAGHVSDIPTDEELGLLSTGQRESLVVLDKVQPDPDLEKEAAAAAMRFSQVLNNSVVKRYKETAGERATFSSTVEARPWHKLNEIESRLGRTPEQAAAEADRALDLLDVHVQYPSEPLPSKMPEDQVRETIDAMLNRIKKGNV